MKHDLHARQIIQTAHRIITHMNALIENFHKGDDHWKTCAALVRYDAEHLLIHYEGHKKLVQKLKEESE